MPTYHKVAPTGLASLFRHNNSPEHDRRATVVRQVIRYATLQVAQINSLANKLMTLAILDLINNNQPIPLRLSDQNQTIWNWCTSLCSTLHQEDKDVGPKQHKKYERKTDHQPTEEMTAKKKRKLEAEETHDDEKSAKTQKTSKEGRTPTQKEVERKRAKQQKDHLKLLLEQEMTFPQQEATFQHIQHVFNTQLRPLLPDKFIWPDRGSLTDILPAENRKRQVNFNNMYGATLLTRQAKVIRAQVSLLDSFRELKINAHLDEEPLTRGKSAKRKRALRFLCVRYVQYRINRWLWTSDFEACWYKHAGENDLTPIMEDLERIIQDHQQGFGPPTTPLQQPHYRLSTEDAMKHAACYVYYMYYLSQQYTKYAITINESDTSSGEATPSGKWKSFSPIPQTKYEIPFIEINAKAITGLVALSKQRRVWEWAMNNQEKYVPIPKNPKKRKKYVVNTKAIVKSFPIINWLDVRVDKKNGAIMASPTVTYAQHNQEEMFRKFLSPSWGGLIHKGANSKYQESAFEYLISTDGQQARVHITVKLRDDDDASDHDEEEEKGYRPPLTSETLRRWVEKGKQIISVDPGHRDIICAVRHGVDPITIVPPDRPTHKKGKRSHAQRKLAKRTRQAEARQTVYTLSNKRFQDMRGSTFDATLRRWRQEAGLCDIDLYLSQNYDTCRARTWDSAVYSAYARKMLSHWDQIWAEMSQPKYQKLKFRRFQREQQAYDTVAMELSQHTPENVVVLWGNGGFGPTSRGHASAPNKKMRKKLADRGIIIIMVDEYCTSKHTACCLNCSVFSYQRQSGKMKADPSAKKEKLRGLLYCKNVATHGVSPFVGYPHRPVQDLASRNDVVPLDESSSSGEDCPVVDTMSDVGDVSAVVEVERHSAVTSRPWNRDVSAAINIFNRAYHESYGAVPLCFTRPKREAYEG